MDFNLSSGISAQLPTPDQLGGAIGQPGTTGTPTPTGDKTVGGSISGVNASKGAMDAVGVNSLVVDPEVQSAMSTSGLSGMGMDAASILGAAPASMPAAELGASLGNVATDLDQVSNITNAFASDVSGLLGSGSADGKIKGDGETDGTKKDEKGERKGKAEGKRKGGAGEASSPDAEGSVSRAVSPTGETITTTTTDTVSSSGAVVANTSTTMSGPPPKNSSSSGSSSTTSSTSSTGSTETAPPPSDGCNLSLIAAEMAGLTSQESLTMGQQQTSMIDAIGLQAKDTIAQAAAMIKGATMMMTMATIGVCTSIATAAYSAAGISSASKAGDDAELDSKVEGEAALNSKAKLSSGLTDDALQPGAKQESIDKARNSITETKASADQELEKGNITQDQKDSIHKQMDAQSAALSHAQAKNTDAAAASQAQAKGIAAARTGDGSISIANLSKQGIRPGSKVSDEDAEKAIKGGWSDDQKAQYKKAVDSSNTTTQSEMLTKPAAAFKTNVANLKLSQNTSAWHQAYQTHVQSSQIYAGVGTSIAQAMNAVGNMEETLQQAQGTKDSAAAQVEGATIQAMSTGISQTQQVADQLRQSQTSVVEAESTMVSATRV